MRLYLDIEGKSLMLKNQTTRRARGRIRTTKTSLRSRRERTRIMIKAVMMMSRGTTVKMTSVTREGEGVPGLSPLSRCF